MEELIHFQMRKDHLDSEHFGEYAHLLHVCAFYTQKGQIEDKTDLEGFFCGEMGPLSENLILFGGVWFA